MTIMEPARRFLALLFLIAFISRLDAATVRFSVQGLWDGDDATVSLGSSEWLSTLNVDADGEYSFKDVPEGLHALKITATGYNVPASRLVRVNADGTVDPGICIRLVVTPLSENPDHWVHEWSQDDSVEGYTKTSNVINPPEIEFLGKKIVPSNVPSMSILNEKYGIILCDEQEKWTQEYAYRLLETMKTLPCEGFMNTKTKFILTNNRLTDDITLEKVDGGNILTISKDAFVYANPLLVNLDGVRGRFFSKRLHHAMTKFVTDFGENNGVIDEILYKRFGVSVNVPDYVALTSATTKEDAACFQRFGPSELVAIINMFEELPEGFHKTPHLNYLVRRIDGHRHPWYPEAAGVAWCLDNGYIEFMNNDLAKAFGGNNEQFETQRLILHEKTHFLWAYMFSDELKKDWADTGGWYRDPNAQPDKPDEGWATSQTTEFVSQYAHDKNPDEDMAESVAYYLKDPEKLMSRAPKKYDFIRDRVMHGTRYISSIPDHLTFEVLNLYPDYDYPGKIRHVSISVDGAHDAEKTITMEIELNNEDGFQDDASGASVRITSPEFTDQNGERKSQYVDLAMSPVDGNGHRLRGTAVVNEYSKAGYWTCGSINVTDLVGNERFEGNNDCITNVYINNPKEDLESPVYKKGTLQYELTEGVDDGHRVQLLKVSYEVSDNIGIRSTFIRVDNDYEGWSKGGTGLTDCYGGYNPETGKAEIIYKIPEFYPCANYFVTFLSTIDLGGTEHTVHFSESELHEPVKRIAITTPNPDYKAPEIDLNRIIVYAEPTHPDNPDGETLVTINFYARDNISGFGPMMYHFRDPQGLIHGNYWFYHRNSSGIYFDGDPTVWEHYKLTHLLPQGSAPGIWGLANVTVADKAGNEQTYNFVETLIFEPDDSDDYVLFADFADDTTIELKLTSNINPGYGYTYRIIHEETGHELTGTCLPGKSQYSPGRSDSSQSEGVQSIDVSSLDDGRLIIIVNVVDENNENVSVKSKILEKISSTAVTEISGDIDYEKEMEIYDLKGTRLNGPISRLDPGVYILRQGENVRKIMIR